MIMRRWAFAAVVAAAAFAGVTPVAPRARAQAPPAFAAQIASLSEPGGYFDTDNLISNERSYLHVLPDLERAGVKGGAYVGVGPDQNFSYIAQVRPAVAYLVDIRRDNLLLHLLFKALFGASRTRVEYLSLLTGRAPPEGVTGWEARPIDAIVKYVDEAASPNATAVSALRARMTDRVKAFGVPLSAGDLATIDRFHRQFIAEGLGLQFTSTGRAPQIGYPTLRDLVLETDMAGRRSSYLASEDAFQFVKGLQARDLVIPVVGDLSGPKAVVAIGRAMAARGERLSAFYTSNVEFYLFREGTFGRFVSNLSALPRQPQAVIIRSVFNGGVRQPGYNSASLIQPVTPLVDGFPRGQFQQYYELTVPRGGR